MFLISYLLFQYHMIIFLLLYRAVLSNKNIAEITNPISIKDYCTIHKQPFYHTFMYNQCVINHLGETNCISDNLFGMRNITCDQVLQVYMIGGYSNDILLSNLRSTDTIITSNPPRMIRIVISNLSISNFTETDILAIESQLDEFLTPRPWWKILHESRDDLILQQQQQHDNDNDTLIITLERYPLKWYRFLDYLVQTQYMSEEKCEKNPIIVGRKSAFHPGTMPVLTVFSDGKSKFPFAIFQTYWPGATSFMSESDCNQLNKWNCAFLPMTNCSIPKAVLDCRVESCLNIDSKGLMWMAAYDKASYNGSHIADVEKEPGRGGKFMLEHQRHLGNDQRKPFDFKFIRPYDDSLWRPQYPSTFSSIFIYLFMTRPTGFYRLKMKNLIQELSTKKENPLYSHTPCVAVHIRRGDRIRANVNMLEFCANVTHDANDSNIIKNGCVDLNHPTSDLIKCPKEVNQDFGCRTIPFEAVRLKHIITKIPRLVKPIIYDLLVFSDDPMFVEDQAKELKLIKPEWQIHSLKSPDLPSNLKIVDHSNNQNHNPGHIHSQSHLRHEDYLKAVHYIRGHGTDSGVYFHSSLKAAQQCSALIAHYGSGVASLFYSSMCIEHGGRYGVCPPTYDMRWGL